MGVSWELHWKKELLFLRTKMWRVATLWLALAGLELISGSPLPVSQKDSPSSSNAKEEWFKSDSPGQKQPSEAQFPKADAIKESPNTNSESSAQKKSDSSDPAEKEEPNWEACLTLLPRQKRLLQMLPRQFRRPKLMP